MDATLQVAVMIFFWYLETLAVAMFNSYGQHLNWERCVPCRHRICNTRAPIANSGIVQRPSQSLSFQVMHSLIFCYFSEALVCVCCRTDTGARKRL
jgi:hypothetical protein